MVVLVLAITVLYCLQRWYEYRKALASIRYAAVLMSSLLSPALLRLIYLLEFLSPVSNLPGLRLFLHPFSRLRPGLSFLRVGHPILETDFIARKYSGDSTSSTELVYTSFSYLHERYRFS